MVTETYLFRWIKSWRNPVLNGKANFRHSRKWDQTRHLNMPMVAMATTRGRHRKLSTLLILLILNQLTPNLASWERFMNSTYLTSLRGIHFHSSVYASVTLCHINYCLTITMWQYEPLLQFIICDDCNLNWSNISPSNKCC